MGHFSIGLTASMLGVCVKTLRRWEESGYLVPAFRTSGGHRRYAYTQLQSFFEGDTDTSQLTVLYARVSSYDQKSDLGVSIEVLDHRVQSPSESLVKDVIELMTVMSARMHGRRAHAHRQLRQDYA